MVSPRRFRSSRPRSVPPGRLLPHRPAASRAVVLALLTVTARAGRGARRRSARDPSAAPRRWSAVPAAGATGRQPAQPRRRRRTRRSGPAPARRTRRCRASCGRCSTRPRPSPSSGTPLRTTSPRGRPSWGPCATRSSPARRRPTPPRGDEEQYREQVDTVAHVDVRERPPRRVQRAAGQRDAAGLPRPDVGAGDDRRRARGGSGPADQPSSTAPGARRPTPTPPSARAQAAADEAARAEQELGGPQARRGPAHRRGRGAAAPADPERAARPPRPGGGRARAAVTGTGAGVRALRAAASQLGKPYRWGAGGPRSFDCSGLTSFAFRQAGITLPRSSCQQARVGQAGAVGRPAARRPRVLLHARQPRGHLRRRREDDQRAADRRRRALPDRVNRRTFSGARRL